MFGISANAHLENMAAVEQVVLDGTSKWSCKIAITGKWREAEGGCSPALHYAHTSGKMVVADIESSCVAINYNLEYWWDKGTLWRLTLYNEVSRRFGFYSCVVCRCGQGTKQ